MSGVSDSPRELSIISEWFQAKPQLRASGSTELAEIRKDSGAAGPNACVLVSVADSGPGLDLDNMDRLFDAFYTTKPQGLGMGLSISRSIIEAHGGRLWAKASVPKGALFEFTLPIC
jgi:signal transduction histidine kinase